MTELSETRLNPAELPAMRRRAAKSSARATLDAHENHMTMIAAALLPVLLYVMLGLVYAMMQLALPQAVRMQVDTVANVIMAVLTLPLFSGTLYVALGLAQGQERHVRDIFRAFTSLTELVRTCVSWLLALCIPFATVLVGMMLRDLSYALCNIVSESEKWSIYIDLFLTAGDLFIFIAACIGMLLGGYLFSLLWLVQATPRMPLSRAIRVSCAIARGHLFEILCFQISFLGWLVLSVCTVGILLVLFVLPYYLVAASHFILSLCRELSGTDADATPNH